MKLDFNKLVSTTQGKIQKLAMKRKGFDSASAFTDHLSTVSYNEHMQKIVDELQERYVQSQIDIAKAKEMPLGTLTQELDKRLGSSPDIPKKE